MNFSNHSDLQNNLSNYINSVFSNTLDLIKKVDKRVINRDLLFIKMVLTIKSLVDNEEFEKELIDKLFKILYPEASSRDIDTTSENNIVYTSTMRILRRIRSRKTTTISEIFSDRSSLIDILDYVWLRKEGYLRKTTSGIYVNPSIRNISSEARERVVSYRDIVKYLDEIPSKLWRNVFTIDFIQNLNNDDFIKLFSKIYGYSQSIDQTMIQELERRLEKGWIPNWSMWKKIEKRINTSSLENKYLGPYSLKWLKLDHLNRDLINKVLVDLDNLPLQDKWRVISSISDSKYDELLEKLDPITLSVIKNLSKHNTYVRNKALLGQCIVNYIDYLISGNISFLEYSKYILSKISVDQLDPILKPIYRSMILGDFKNTIRFLSRMYGIDIVELIANTVWSNTIRGVNEELLWRAVKISYEILKHNIRGFKYTSRYKYSYITGRLVTRKTVFNIIRGDYSLVRRFREREIRIVSLIDISGSMMKHSLWAVLALSSIIRFVKTILLFSDKVTLSIPPRSFTKSMLINYLEKLFSEGFKGYTNISMAFREVTKLSNRRDIVVLFSDLEQTVPDTDPVLEIKKFIETTGSRLIVFTPPVHNYETREKLEKIGVETIIVKDPSKIPRLLKKKLNLKI